MAKTKQVRSKCPKKTIPNYQQPPVKTAIKSVPPEYFSSQSNDQSKSKSSSQSYQQVPISSKSKKITKSAKVVKAKVKLNLRQKWGFEIPLRPFSLLVRDVMNGFTPDLNTGYKIQSDALMALQCAAEDFLTKRFEKINTIARYMGRVTIKAKDIRLLNELDHHEYEPL